MAHVSSGNEGSVAPLVADLHHNGLLVRIEKAHCELWSDLVVCKLIALNWNKSACTVGRLLIGVIHVWAIIDISANSIVIVVIAYST